MTFLVAMYLAAVPGRHALKHTVRGTKAPKLKKIIILMGKRTLSIHAAWLAAVKLDGDLENR
jgi:hypothetical protein